MMGRQKKDPRAAYLKQVKKCLSCPSWEKERLMSGLENEIDEAFPSGAMSLEAIAVRFGNPLILARELEMSLSAESLARYIERKRLWIFAGYLCCAVIIALLIGYMVWLSTHDTNYIISSVYYT